MLDLKFIRENPQVVQKAAKDKGIDIDINHVLEIDNKYCELKQSVQKLREERNRFSREKNIEEGRKIKDRLGKEEYALKSVGEELQNKLFQIPNLPLASVPVGDPSRLKIIKKHGTPKKFDFTLKDHLELGEKLDIIDVQRAAKVSGTRFAYLKNEGALLELALIQFVMEKLFKEGFIPIFPPMLIKRKITEGLGYWTRENHNNYYLVTDFEEVEDGKEKENPLYLIGTAEHSIVSMHKDEVFRANDLPKKYIGFSSAFRREAGTYGKDTRGILRVHQFDKLEMVEFVKPDEDEKERRKMLFLSENFIQDLELPYQLVKLASEDLAFPSAETIDIETWIPSQNKYRETHSISTTTDFQARRLNIKYQEGSEKKYAHILNGTAFAIGRTIVAILENYQQEDGSVVIPEVLRKYLNNLEKITPKKH